jgi:hypothetical protein
VIMYRLENGRYGRPDVAELTGETAPEAVPGGVIHWERVTRRLPAPVSEETGTRGNGTRKRGQIYKSVP